MPLRINLLALRRDLEIRRGHAVSWRQIARETGLHMNTVYDLAGQRSRRVDWRTVEALYEFFQRELGIGINEFIVERDA